MLRNNRSIEAIKLIAKENPKAVTIVCTCLLLASMFEAVGISAIFPIISSIMETGTDLPESRFTDFIRMLSNRGLYFLSFFVVGCFLIKAVILDLVYRVVAKHISEFSHNLRLNFVNAMLNANVHFIFSKSMGENLAILTDSSIRAGAAYNSATRIISGLFQVAIYFSYALWLSFEATLLSILTIGVLYILVKKTMGRAKQAGADTTKYVQEITRNMGEALRGVKEAKATAREGYLAKYIYEDSEMLRRSMKVTFSVAQRLRCIQDPVTISSALVCLIIFKEVLHLEPGYILFILAVYYKMMSSANMLIGDYQRFLSQEPALWAIKEGTQAARDAKEKKQEGVAPSKTPEDISFENVSMSFGEKKVFSDISFVLPAKKLSVFKGESGRGKTTSIDIICNLIEPTSGTVKVGDHTLSGVDTVLWRKNIGYVDQFPFLFKGTVRENILLDMEDVSEEAVLACMRSCHLDQFLSERPEGLDFELNEGGLNISGGQRQRIAIARSVIRDPSYLILDEPTSALDRESAEAVFTTLKDLSKKMSVIVISHSAMADQYADKVVDFDVFA